MKNKYDSAIVFLYATGNEHLLPKEFRKQIPYTTISSWRKTDYSSYIGNEFRYFFDEAFEGAEAKLKYRQLKRMMMAFARSWVSLSGVLKPVIQSAGNNNLYRKKILDAIGSVSNFLGMEKTLKFIGITRAQYQQWLLVERFNCFDSHSSLCVKRHPYQLEAKEIAAIKKMLTDPELDHWPIVSIASLALRNKSITASLFSWYKYARAWGFSKKPAKKDVKTVGLIANYPNEYLHVDVTEIYAGGQKAYIAFVMDNYSKMILGWGVSRRRTFRVVKEALRKAMDIIITHPAHDHSFLVTDGGSENNNRHIDEFIKRITNHKVTKIRALKEIQFSNSPVEAIHRTMKGRYLRNRIFSTLKEVSEFLEWAVYDYNVIRPHYKHAPKTPKEAYFNVPLGFDIKKRVQRGMKNRIENNRCSKCMQCSATRKASCTNKCEKYS
jgi:hypothetical protein